MEAVWPGTTVEEANLTVHISTLRRILDQNRENGSSIQTVPGRGYRFIASVTRAEPASPPTLVRPSGNGGGLIAGNGQSRDRIAPDQIDSIPQLPALRMRPRFRWGAMASAVGPLILAAAVAVGIWYSRWSEPAHRAPRLSIVVMPFANLSDDREQQYFADGITDDLTNDLSRIAGMFVISRNTAFTYRD